MSLGIVIINYHTPAVTIDCLASLAPQINDVPNTRVVLVDNASGDDSVPKLRDAIESRGWGNWVALVESPFNLGFAGGNNLGIHHCKNCTYILLLNSDTLAQPGVLKYCVEKMDDDRGAGLMSCMLLNPDQTVQNTARKFPTPTRLAAYSLGLPWSFPKLFAWADIQDPGWDRKTEARDVDWVGGAFMLIRRDMLERIGVLDEGFFFYGEDAEFCHRARRNHYRVKYDPGAAVIHLAGASSDPQRLAQKQREVLTWQARYRLQRRCWGYGAEVFIRCVDILAYTLRFSKLLVTGQRATPQYAKQREVLALLLRWPRSGTIRG